jgi:hypothetical protein
MNKRDKMLEAFLDIENEKINFKTTMDILNNYIIIGLTLGASLYITKYPNKILDIYPQFNRLSGIILIIISTILVALNLMKSIRLLLRSKIYSDKKLSCKNMAKAIPLIFITFVMSIVSLDLFLVYVKKLLTL